MFDPSCLIVGLFGNYWTARKMKMIRSKSLTSGLKLKRDVVVLEDEVDKVFCDDIIAAAAWDC